jgi:hypothetical protein
VIGRSNIVGMPAALLLQVIQSSWKGVFFHFLLPFDVIRYMCNVSESVLF